MSAKTIIMMGLGLLALYGLFTVGSPFLLAIVIALFLEPVIVPMMKVFRLNRPAASAIVCTLFTLLLFGLAYLLGLQMVAQLVEFWDKAPHYFTEASKYFQDATERTQLFYDSLPGDMAEQVQSGIEAGVTALTNSLNGIMKSISGYFIGFAKFIPTFVIYFIVFLVALYLFSIGMPRIKQSFLSLFEEKSQGKVDEVLQSLRSSVFGFLRAQVILSAMTYIIAMIGLLILKVEYPLAISLLVVLVDILPILGVGSALVPWALYSIITGNAFLAVGLIILFVVITVVRRIIEPKVLGDAVGIGALPALVGLYVGFELFGVIGLFLGPIIVIIYQAMRKVGLLQFKIKLE
ncbi:sporulation integral membrane protein YtvI [Paenibacillus koleovorans]|uniref:sporulation integral membrane protein YtvI n=1 Tax=Paenibacillus koleovorans TaxID=121608 RepID=UPI000FDBC929|nr:sporulation integral membrane protein YtvI [Paenibacillus koleovorans]